MTPNKKVLNLLKALVAGTLIAGLSACDQFRDYPKNIQEFPTPWQKLDPGQPLEKFPRIEILEQGGGAIIEPGDLIQIHMQTDGTADGTPHERGDWWLWVGFRTHKDTAFFAGEIGIASAFVGVQQGTLLRFAEAKDHWISAGKLHINPWGDAGYYSWRKNDNDFTEIYTQQNNKAGYYSALRIKRVCKGPLQYRTVRLFDDGPVIIRHGLDSRVSRDPREMWIDEARIEAQCQDGRKAYFQFGPTPSPGRKGRSPVSGYFDDWIHDAWQRLPLGVQFVGNQPPKHAKPYDEITLHTKTDKPISINLSQQVSDPDGDKLSIRFLGPPANGTLTLNSDATFTYTPKPGWAGAETLKYKVSDGLVEGEGVARVTIRVDKPQQ